MLNSVNNQKYFHRAMGGQVLFQEALAARLELIKPSKSDIEKCLAKHPLKLTEGIRKVVELLHARGTPVYLVSGGFRQVLWRK
jgi:phosphoserine phosphatase